MPKIVKSGRFLDRLLVLLLKVGLPLMKNALKASAKSVLIPLGLTQQRQQKIQLFKIKIISNSKQRNGRYHENN